MILNQPLSNWNDPPSNMFIYLKKTQTSQNLLMRNVPRITDGRSDLLPNPSQNLRSIGAGHWTWTDFRANLAVEQKKKHGNHSYTLEDERLEHNFLQVFFSMFFRRSFYSFFFFMGDENFACTAQSHKAKVGSELFSDFVFLLWSETQQGCTEYSTANISICLDDQKKGLLPEKASEFLQCTLEGITTARIVDKKP